MTGEKATTTPEKPKAKAPKAEQDQLVADRITAALQSLSNAQTDPELKQLLAEHGYDEKKLAVGRARQQAAQSAFAARQQAIGAKKQATDAAVAAEAAACQAYMNFRDTARTIFRDKGAQSALGLAGKVPTDLQKFTTAASGTYESAVLPAKTSMAMGQPSALHSKP